jgi:hypothetical protein
MHLVLVLRAEVKGVPRPGERATVDKNVEPPVQRFLEALRNHIGRLFASKLAFTVRVW